MHCFILLDRSGSMGGRWPETMQALNAFAGRLARDVSDAMVSLAVFDDVSGKLDFAYLRKGQPVRGWKSLAEDEAEPRGSTPLYDAIGRITDHIKAAAEDKMMLVVITDGHENASRKLDKDRAKAALDQVKERGWDITFLGADFENFDQAQGLGIAHGSTMVMAHGFYDEMGDALSVRAARYASSAVPANAAEFSDEEREKARGKR
jgi:hypothetical protein